MHTHTHTDTDNVPMCFFGVPTHQFLTHPPLKLTNNSIFISTQNYAHILRYKFYGRLKTKHNACDRRKAHVYFSKNPPSTEIQQKKPETAQDKCVFLGFYYFFEIF